MADKSGKEEAGSHKGNFSNFKQNPWMTSTVVVGVVALVLLILLFSGNIGGNAVSSSTAGENVVSFIEAQGGQASLVSSTRDGSMYNVIVNYQGQDVPVFVSLDGKYLIANPIPLTGGASAPSSNTASQPSANVPKSDKPKVELFVMSYCPYGTQMEKAILPVVSALKDKIDFTLRYTHFTLHGEKEDTENFRQLCIREEQGSKFLSYIQCTLNSTDPYSPADVNVCMQSLGIDSVKVNSCITGKAKDYYAVDSQLSQGYGVQGSPTLVINGVQANANRSPASVLSTICSAFNNAPAECSTALPTASASAGFGYNSGSSADSAAIQCGV